MLFTNATSPAFQDGIIDNTIATIYLYMYYNIKEDSWICHDALLWCCKEYKKVLHNSYNSKLSCWNFNFLCL